MRHITTLGALALIIGGITLSGCGGGRGMEKAMADEHTQVKGNSHSYAAPPERVLRAVATSLVQHGYTIESSDTTLGLIKATRIVQDPKDKNTSYHITANASVGATGDAKGSVLTLAAGQQTVVHHEGHNWTWFPLIPIIPIPSGRNDSTLVTSEGGIVKANFYDDFFAAVEQVLATTATSGATSLAAGAPRVEEKEASPPAESAQR